MARIIPDGFAEARFVMSFTGDPDPWICTLGIDQTSSSGFLEAQALALYDAWRLRILIGQSNKLTLTRVDYVVGNGTPFPAIITHPGGAVGGLAGNVLPQNSAVLVQKRTGLGGRRNRGRMFVPAMLSESVVDDVGVITTSARNDIQTQFNNFRNDIVAADLEPVLLHAEGISPVIPPTPVTSFLVDTRISTQRRRLR